VKIKDIVCSLELAKKLKELGVVQKSIYGWVNVNGAMAISHLLDHIGDCPEICSAFTSDELLEILPNPISANRDGLWLHYRFNLTRAMLVINDSCWDFESNFIINYICTSSEFKINFKEENLSPFFATNLILHNFYDKKLSDALAKILINLLENKIITLE
jgi:hypothetical protein